MHQGDEVCIDLINTGDQPPYRVFGTFRSEGEDYVRITGTVGEDIGKDILVPRANVKLITILT
jgi:hypothetical protein